MLIILDRDGVINEDSDESIKTPDEWIAIPGSLEAIAKLNKFGHQVVIASNQSGVARGLFDLFTLKLIHRKMQNELAKVNGHLDAIFYCPHHPDAHCECRKPKPGLLLQIAEAFAYDLTKAIVVGDALRDIQAAQAVGSKAILVKTGKGTETLNKNLDILKGAEIYENLSEFVDAICGNCHPHEGGEWHIKC